MNDRGAQRGELSLAEHRRLLDQITDAGCLWLLFTGGEIFARSDFLDIYEYAKSKGLLITLFTNGTMITPAIADRLAAMPPFAIEITLYGFTEHTYERLTGQRGSYARCLRGIQLLRERGLPLKLKTVAVTLNTHELGEMKSFAEEQLGLEFKFDAMMNPRVDCSQSPLAVRLTPEEIVKLDLQDESRMAEWRRFAAEFVRRPASSLGAGGTSTPELYHCGGGLNSFAVDPQGRMSICVLSQAEGYDLRGGTFLDGWEAFLKSVRARKITRRTKCVECQLKSLCGMCPANGELENGDPEAPVEFLCEVAHLRAKAIGISVPTHGECAYCQSASQELIHGPRVSPAGHSSIRRVSSLGVVGADAPAVDKAASGRGCHDEAGACGSCRG
jgi:radical SAM protein with 4Fe4S-binding SPASM domain